MTDLESKSKHSYFSNFETRSVNVLELMESIFGPVPINPVNIIPSIINEIWPRYKITFDVNFSVNFPLVLCILSSVNVKPTRVIKLLYDHLNLNCENVNSIPSGPLTIVSKGPHYGVTRNFASSIHTDTNFRHCLPP